MTTTRRAASQAQTRRQMLQAVEGSRIGCVGSCVFGAAFAVFDRLVKTPRHTVRRSDPAGALLLFGAFSPGLPFFSGFEDESADLSDPRHGHTVVRQRPSVRALDAQKGHKAARRVHAGRAARLRRFHRHRLELRDGSLRRTLHRHKVTTRRSGTRVQHLDEHLDLAEEDTDVNRQEARMKDTKRRWPERRVGAHSRRDACGARSSFAAVATLTKLLRPSSPRPARGLRVPSAGPPRPELALRIAAAPTNALPLALLERRSDLHTGGERLKQPIVRCRGTEHPRAPRSLRDRARTMPTSGRAAERRRQRASERLLRARARTSFFSMQSESRR